MGQSGEKRKWSSAGRNRRCGGCISSPFPSSVSIVSSFYCQSSIAYPMEVFCSCVVALLKYYPSRENGPILSRLVLFVIKGRETPTKHIRGDPFQKLPYEGLSRHSSYASMFYLLCHRYWPIEDYHSLFSFLLEHSRQVVLDSAPCAIALRFLS